MRKHEIENFVLKLKRNSDSHKYDYGHVLTIAGSKNMPGAGVLCCLGALHSGSGLVTYAVKDSFLNQACALSSPEIIFFTYKSANDIVNYVHSRKVSSVVIGPGLKTDFKFVKKIICSLINTPVVLDASGLACFNGKAEELKNIRAKLVITPHLMEFSKILSVESSVIKNDRKKTTADFVKNSSVVCVLKGHNTIVASAKEMYKNNTGTPALATAGSGDVLSGMIASFANVAGSVFEAAKFAVFIHGLTGEIVEKDKGQMGVIASDIAGNICYAIKSLITVKNQQREPKDDNRRGNHKNKKIYSRKP